jgi:hypothetical protein
VTEFRDAIRNVIDFAPSYEDHGYSAHDPQEQADLVLAMPEMEAVRKALQRAYYGLAWNNQAAMSPSRIAGIYKNMGNHGVPESVIAWVLGEDR